MNTMSKSRKLSDIPAMGSQSRSKYSAFTLSALIAITLLSSMLYLAGPWEFLAITRLLDPLVEGGFIQYHDLGPGFIPGLPEVGYYYMSQDLIDWRLIWASAAFMAAYSFLKAVQFDIIARAYGSTGSFGAHLRAFFYGDGLDRFMPFSIGRLARAEILIKMGTTENDAYDTVRTQQAFTLFELIFFAAVGLLLLGWTDWFSQLFWAIACFGLSLYVVSSLRGSGGVPFSSLTDNFRSASKLALRRPGLIFQLAALSVLAFAFVDVAIYMAMTAFDTEIVLINIEKPVLLMAIVGGYISSRLVPITPGGIGQWELGFAAGLYLAKSDVSVAMLSVAIIANIIRIAVGLALMWASMLRYQMPVTLSEITDRLFSKA